MPAVATAPAYLPSLAARLTGELHFDATIRTLYATDASEYQKLPVAVALPKTEADVRELIAFVADKPPRDVKPDEWRERAAGQQAQT